MLNRNPPAGGFVRMTSTISVILNLIQNQLDPDFRQDDSYGDDLAPQLADQNSKVKQKNF